jgi:SAM-dependent methyltransferase
MEGPLKRVISRLISRFDTREKFFRSLPPSPRVLDLGCGSGFNGLQVREMLPEATIDGVDIVRHPQLPSCYSFKQVDLDCGILPFPDDFFDAVVFTHVIEHLRVPLGIGGEVHRVMRRSASIYVETPNWTSVFAPSFGFKRDQHDPFNFYDDPTHVKPWSRQGLFEFLHDSCKLRVVKVGGTRNWLRVPFDLLFVARGLISKDRRRVIASFWNLYGWCIYGVGTKD